MVIARMSTLRLIFLKSGRIVDSGVSGFCMFELSGTNRLIGSPLSVRMRFCVCVAMTHSVTLSRARLGKRMAITS